MTGLLLLAFAIVAGSFLPLQAGINARLAHFVGGPVRASAISFFVGTVVLVHQRGAGYEVEFATLGGDTFAVVTLDAADVRPVDAREIVHARAVN